MLSGGDQPLDDTADLRRRHRLDIVVRADPGRVQDLRP
jgi:hypothetical protein